MREEEKQQQDQPRRFTQEDLLAVTEAGQFSDAGSDGASSRESSRTTSPVSAVPPVSAEIIPTLVDDSSESDLPQFRLENTPAELGALVSGVAEVSAEIIPTLVDDSSESDLPQFRLENAPAELGALVGGVAEVSAEIIPTLVDDSGESDLPQFRLENTPAELGALVGGVVETVVAKPLGYEECKEGGSTGDRPQEKPPESPASVSTLNSTDTGVLLDAILEERERQRQQALDAMSVTMSVRVRDAFLDGLPVVGSFMAGLLVAQIAQLPEEQPLFAAAGKLTAASMFTRFQDPYYHQPSLKHLFQVGHTPLGFVFGLTTALDLLSPTSPENNVLLVTAAWTLKTMAAFRWQSGWLNEVKSNRSAAEVASEISMAVLMQVVFVYLALPAAHVLAESTAPVPALDHAVLLMFGFYLCLHAANFRQRVEGLVEQAPETIAALRARLAAVSFPSISYHPVVSATSFFNRSFSSHGGSFHSDPGKEPLLGTSYDLDRMEEGGVSPLQQ